MALLTHRDYIYVNTLELLDGLIFIEYLELRHSFSIMGSWFYQYYQYHYRYNNTNTDIILRYTFVDY